MPARVSIARKYDRLDEKRVEILVELETLESEQQRLENLMRPLGAFETYYSRLSANRYRQEELLSELGIVNDAITDLQEVNLGNIDQTNQRA